MVRGYTTELSRFDNLIKYLESGQDAHDMSGHERFVDAVREMLQFGRVLGFDFDKAVNVAKAELLQSQAVGETAELKEFGAVKFFNAREGRTFGFLEDNTFFHLNNGLVLACTGANQPEEIGKESRHPNIGEQVVFQSRMGPKGKVAVWWAYRRPYEQAQWDCQNRPTIRFRDTVTPMTRWEGKDLAHLRLLYGRELTHGRYDMGHHVFEALDPLTNEWKQIDDPR